MSSGSSHFRFSQYLTGSLCYKFSLWSLKEVKVSQKDALELNYGKCRIQSLVHTRNMTTDLNVSLTSLPNLWKCNINLPCMYKSKYLNGTKYIFLHCSDQHIHTVRSGLHPGFFLKLHSFPEQGSCSHWVLYDNASKLTTWSALFHWKDSFKHYWMCGLHSSTQLRYILTQASLYDFVRNLPCANKTSFF